MSNHQIGLDITYAAYGSNMNRCQMLARTKGEAEAIGTALLRDWQLEFRRGVLTVERQPGAVVPLALWLISDSAKKALDRYEGAPWLYAPQTFQGTVLDVLSGERPENFLIYEMTADGINTLDRPHFPNVTYFDICRQGYDDSGLSEWLSMLEAARERSLCD